MDEEQSAAAFMAAVEQIQQEASSAITATGAAVLLAIHQDIATDSRSIANRLGLAHALVLREIAALSPRFVRVTKRDARTQRSFLEVTAEGQALAASPSRN
jgi:DNA-binding MarR family transcriptional regulator